MANGEREYWGPGALQERFDRIDRDLQRGQKRMALIEEGQVAFSGLEKGISDSLLEMERRFSDKLEEGLEQLRSDFREDLRDAGTHDDRKAGWTRWKVAQVLVALGLVITVFFALQNQSHTAGGNHAGALPRAPLHSTHRP